MYSGTQSCISVNGKCSSFFPCSRGVRQGVNLSPILFLLFLNDLEHYITTRTDIGVDLSNDMLDVYLKLVVVLYADDTVLFANSEEELVTLLNTFSSYCKEWKLDINFDKTQIMVFGDRFKRNRHIVIDGFNIEVVDTFKYLGIVFSKK